MAFFICANCGFGSGSWIGKCPDCGEWNTLKEQRDGTGSKEKGRNESTQKLSVTPLSKIAPLTKGRIPTGIFEFDRVLGGGMIPGEVLLLTGEPGVGKSTLLLQSLKNLMTLYISGEEAAEQISQRAERLGVDSSKFLFSDTLQTEGIVEGVEEIKDKIQIIVIDSIQTVYSKNVDGNPGSVTQLRESAAQLIRLAKESKVPIILIGHVTKEGDIAGPKTLEHMVDAVLNFEGERMSHFRVLRAAKNRFGSTDEIGIFEMVKEGLQEVTNPLAFLDEDAKSEAPGKAVVGVMEGKRPLFFEVQTLASPTFLAMPRRVVRGVDYNKVQLLLAVIRKHLNISLDKFDIYINVIGGVDIKSPAADLGIVASIISSVKNVPLATGSLFTGEVGLLGEVRKVYAEAKVLSDAKRLHFKHIYSSESTKSIKDLYHALTRG